MRRIMTSWNPSVCATVKAEKGVITLCEQKKLYPDLRALQGSCHRACMARKWQTVATVWCDEETGSTSLDQMVT